MTYDEKVALWKDYVSTKKIQKSYTVFPAIFGIRLGKEPEPLIFQPFAKIAVLLGARFGITWGVLMHFTAWRTTPISIQFGGAVSAGLLFGITMAFVIQRQRTKLGLATWEQCLREAQVSVR